MSFDSTYEELKQASSDLARSYILIRFDSTYEELKLSAAMVTAYHSRNPSTLSNISITASPNPLLRWRSFFSQSSNQPPSRVVYKLR